MKAEHFDVLIVGAGLSGIGAAVHLTKKSPHQRYVIFESRGAMGGTWDLFRYPGVRSDSDMFTLGYAFKPWGEAKAIADGPSIRAYIQETAREHGIDQHIRYHQRIIKTTWSTADARWTVEVERTDQAEQKAQPARLTVTCAFLFLCSGYYRYDEGHRPTFPGSEQFQGTIVHPQHWPAQLDYRGKRVVVIGSGATAVTLVPAMAEAAAHVTMLQRSPTYIMSLPANDKIADRLRRWLPSEHAYRLVRLKNVLFGMGGFQLSRRRPDIMKSLLRKGVERALPEGFDIEKHFTPTYQPWDQRLCLVPDGDLFKAISAGRASVVTDQIESFTPRGIRLASGEELPADVIVTATGLELLAFGGIRFEVDGREIDLSKSIAYRGLMLCGVPNLAYALGYTNASWTLKVDLVADHVCRLLNRMHRRGERICLPEPPPPEVRTEPFLGGLSSGYVKRAADKMPRQGDRVPWKLYQNYARDLLQFKLGKLAHKSLRFSR